MSKTTFFYFFKIAAIALVMVFIVWNCEKPTTPDEVNIKRQNYIRLQNQTEHSGVLIKLVDTKVLAVTDSQGYFILPKTTDGEYILQAKYPFFKIIEQKVKVVDSLLETNVQIELKQQLQFWVEPAETTITIADKSRFWESKGYVKNISDTTVWGISYTIPNNWGIIPEGLEWNYIHNDIDPNFCYQDIPIIGLTDLLGIGGFSIQPGDTGIYKYKDLWQLGYKCTPPGRTYLLFFSLVDQKYFDEYFQNRFYLDGKVDSSQIINPLLESFFKKRELFRPAIINFTN
ncbi:MAG: hypothetical protein ABFS12_11755 [Bacteroidota bacterium]